MLSMRLTLSLSQAVEEGPLTVPYGDNATCTVARAAAKRRWTVTHNTLTGEPLRVQYADPWAAAEAVARLFPDDLTACRVLGDLLAGRAYRRLFPVGSSLGWPSVPFSGARRSGLAAPRRRHRARRG